VLGQYKDLVGYASPLETNKLFKAIDITRHAGSWSIPAALLGGGAIIVLFLLKRSPVRKWADILIIILATVFVVLTGWQEVELVGDISAVPSGLAALPRPVLPDLTLVPALLGGTVAAVVVGLAESSGAGAAYPNPDGSRSSMSGDFTGQGLGNIAGSFFQAMPAGGSLSRTGLNASGGGRTRWAGVYAGVLIAAVLVLFGRYAELIPMTGLAALLIVIGFEVMLKEGRELLEAWQISRLNTFVAVLVILFGVFTDLTRAIFAGVFLSLLLYAFVSADRFKIVVLRQDDRGEWEERPLPEQVPSNQATVVQLRGNAYFASVYSYDELLPTPEDLSKAVIVFRARERNIASLTGLDWFKQYAVKLRETGNLFMLSDVEPELMETLEKTAGVEIIGKENIFLAESELFASTKKALTAAEAWIKKK
jgi:SulP family sulfate permease